MKKDFKLDDEKYEIEEEQLFELIKQAGNEARIRKKEAMAKHRDRLRAAAEEGVLHRRDSVSI